VLVQMVAVLGRFAVELARPYRPLTTGLGPVLPVGLPERERHQAEQQPGQPTRRSL
jgi:hypothetical protein